MSIVITGSPGVGKHTVSKKISAHLGCQLIDINQVALSAGLADPDGGDVDVDILGNMIRPTLDISVIVGHLAPYALDVEHVKMVAILRQSPYNLEEIYQSRGYSRDKIFDNIGSEILGTIATYTHNKFGKKAFEIDASKYNAEQTASAIISIIISNVVPQNTEKIVDWLDQVARKGDLQRFFKY